METTCTSSLNLLCFFEIEIIVPKYTREKGDLE